ncbi:MAG: hypothetical protein WC380_05260 [Pedobacter sp.]
MEKIPVPEIFVLQSGDEVHPASILAAIQLQEYLTDQQDWKHNFGLIPQHEGTIIGKMFGVLVVKNKHNEIGFLAAFSGKLDGRNHHSGFVPPVFDSLNDNNFLNKGMAELKDINMQIQNTLTLKEQGFEERIDQLKNLRKNNSVLLQTKLFKSYIFLNRYGEEKSLTELFKNASYKNPPAGAGECAGPKLLQYAFENHMKPLALAEFWWGQSPKSDYWKHKHFYPCCKEKCGPILTHMLEGL